MLAFKAIKENGKYSFTDKARFVNYISGLKNGEYLLTVKRLFKKRSLNQNSYYHGCVVEIVAEFMGEDHDSAHEALRYEFLKVLASDGKPFRLKSTTELTTVEFEEYMSKIRRKFMIDYNVSIPEPSETEFNYEQ